MYSFTYHRPATVRQAANLMRGRSVGSLPDAPSSAGVG